MSESAGATGRNGGGWKTPDGDASATLVRRTVLFEEGGRLRRSSLRMERFFWDAVGEIVEAEGITPVEFFSRVRALRQGSFAATVRRVVIGFLREGSARGLGRLADQSAAARLAGSAARLARDAAEGSRPPLRLIE